MLTAIWHMLTHGVPYTDPGGDFYTRRNPDKARNRAIDQLRQLGYTVTLSPLPSAVTG
jgi:transposase